MKIGIVGWGLEAQSAFRFFGPDHEYLIVNETLQNDFPAESDRVRVRFLSTKAPAGIAGQINELSYLEDIDGCDKVIFQPTAYFNLKKVFGDNPEFWAKATTVYDVFFENTKSKNIIGVTGTKGKGTTSTLIAKMLEAQGKRIHLGGNIGTPILDLLPSIQPDDWIVWELANFQLKAASYSPHIAVCLMIVPEHLDWHPDIEDYIEAKAQIFKHQQPEDVAVYFPFNRYSTRIAGYSKGTKIPYFQKPGATIRPDGMIVIGEDEKQIAHKSDVKLLGEHNLQNVCAALTAVSEALGSLDPGGVVRDSGIPLGQTHGASPVNAVGGSSWVDKAKTVLSSFTGLEHRLELVRSLGGVNYYDDSFGTTPETAIVAMKALPQPKIMILGGSEKGADFGELADEVMKNNVKHAITIGPTGEKIAILLKNRGFTSLTEGLTTMPEIVAAARKMASPGDAVLLSTGSASFGLFKNYKDRGEQFKDAVNSL